MCTFNFVSSLCVLATRESKHVLPAVRMDVSEGPADAGSGELAEGDDLNNEQGQAKHVRRKVPDRLNYQCVHK